MAYINISQINRQIEQSPRQFVSDCEREYEDNLLLAARRIANSSARRPIVLLSGPSGSGKTTTSLRLQQLLNSWGHAAHTISLDNYYYRREGAAMPLDEDGNIDLESPYCLDIPLLRRHLKKITRGETIHVPVFNFVSQRREENAQPLTRRRGEVVIVEGIHALNPAVTGDREYATSIEISVRTNLTAPEEVVLRSRKVRLCRRLLRDRRTRAQSFSDTIRRENSVSRGEKLYIRPHLHLAEISIDTFMPCELSVYRNDILPHLLDLPEGYAEQYRLKDLIFVLQNLIPIDPDLIPETSLIREFIGGGPLG